MRKLSNIMAVLAVVAMLAGFFLNPIGYSIALPLLSLILLRYYQEERKTNQKVVL